MQFVFERDDKAVSILNKEKRKRGTISPAVTYNVFVFSLLLWGLITTVWHFLVVSGQTVRRRPDRPLEKSEHFLVLCSECTIHGAIDDGVDGTTQEPQASGEDEDLRREENNSV